MFTLLFKLNWASPSPATAKEKNNSSEEEALTLTPKRVDNVNELTTTTTNPDEPKRNVHQQVSTLTSLKQQKEEKYIIIELGGPPL